MTDYGDCTATVRYEVNDVDRLYRCDKPNPHNGAHHDNVAGLTWIEPWNKPSRPVIIRHCGCADHPCTCHRSGGMTTNLHSSPPQNVREGDAR